MRSLLRVGVVAACFGVISVSAVADPDSDRRGNPHGSAFKLFGNAEMTRDPENRENIVLESPVRPISRQRGRFATCAT
jgi:hypothetical protein